MHWYGKVPGYRSGTTWKITVATLLYVSIAAVPFIVGLGTVGIILDPAAFKTKGGSPNQPVAAVTSASPTPSRPIDNAPSAATSPSVRVSPTPRPSPLPTPTPSPLSPSPVPTPTPLATPSPSPSPSHLPTAIPSPLQSPVASPTPAADPHTLTVANVTKSIHDNQNFVLNANFDNMKVTISGGVITVTARPTSLYDEQDTFRTGAADGLVVAKATLGWYPSATQVHVVVQTEFTDIYGNTTTED